MTFYDALFKCRLCGKTFTAYEVTDWKDAMNATLYAAGIGGSAAVRPFSPKLTDIHVCAGGGYGIADFLGFAKVECEDNEEDWT